VSLRCSTNTQRVSSSLVGKTKRTTVQMLA